jgi:Protein of unknown function (DUF3349)
MALDSRFSKIAAWLHAGYSGDGPWHGGIPLLALAGRPVSDDDVTIIAAELAFSPDPGSATAVSQAITAVTGVKAADYHVASISSRLAAGR